MPASPFRLLDPELVVPSAASAVKLQFWQRMHEWAEDRGPRVGPSTLQALNELANSPPRVDYLPIGDFWTILSKFTSRGFAPSPTPRQVCEKHLSASYKPLAGGPDNFQRLADDLRAVGPNGRVAVSTIEDCWTETDISNCPACHASKLSRVHTPIGAKSKSDELAEVWRQAYIDEHASDPTQLETFATKMFPSIEFASGAWKRMKTLVGAPEEITASLISHLAVLNDLVAAAWGDERSTEGRQAILGSRGITSSPESPKTHKDKKAMRSRDFQFKSGEVRCEWHTKLRPDVNRIYFTIENGQVLVGAIVDHLPT